MAKAKSNFVCQECGAVYAKWSGHCEACNAWNTIVEEAVSDSPYAKKASRKTSRIEFVDLKSGIRDVGRSPTGIGEFDRVLGGGFVEGSAVLIGGDPGIGKSTLLLQVAALLASGGTKVAYISGEESVVQIKLRASRLGVAQADVQLATSTSVTDMVAAIDAKDGPEFVVVDSIQTIYHEAIDSAPGTVSQVRACAHELIQACKKKGAVLILVGHVTKEGQIAGPKVLEHMVDTVLYFEGERGHQFRIIRAVKNRFGGTDEIGVFEMTEKGLKEVPNPSAIFLSQRSPDISGTAVFAGIEGSRPMLLEIQALVAPTFLASPRRAVVGWDQARLSMILAVLEARCGISLGNREVYLSVAGGFKVSEPAADLAVAAAILSAATNIPLPKEAVYFGEIGLSGEIRLVGRSDMRLKEAEKLGFSKAIVPEGVNFSSSNLRIKSIKRLRDFASGFDAGENMRKEYA